MTQDDLIGMVPDTQPSEFELLTVVLKVFLAGHENSIRIERKHNGIEILLKCRQKNRDKATWKTYVISSLEAGNRELAEKIAAEFRKCILPIRDPSLIYSQFRIMQCSAASFL